MPHIAILADNAKSRAAYLNNNRLPTSYMEDFSILGFTVRHYAIACELLRQEGYTIIDLKNYGSIHIDNASHILSIRDILLKKGIYSNYSDIADTIYQA
jgi:hypothetical protein